MGFLSAIGLGKQVGETIAEPIDAIGNVIDIANRVFQQSTSFQKAIGG